MAAAFALGSDKRRRNLTILGGITAFAVLLAIVAVFQRSSELAQKFEPRPFFPGLTTTVNNLGELAIVSKTGTVHVKLVNDKWTVVERNNFPADFMQLRAAGSGLADLQILEPKTARADWLEYLGLSAPPMGDAVQMTMTDKDGKVLADILIGHAQGAPDALGRNTLYVRKPNENQTWLARGYLTTKADVSDWLEKGVIVIARDRIKGATVTPVTGPAYTMVRDSKEQPDFKVLDLPKGRELAFDGSPDGVAGAISGFTFDDVAKADGFDFSKVAQHVTNTFDGLNITVKIAVKDSASWASVSAAGTNDMTKMEADKINANVNGWAFKLSPMLAQQFTSPRETLLKPPPGK